MRSRPGWLVWVLLWCLVSTMSLRAATPHLPSLSWQPRSDWVNVKLVVPTAVGDGVADDTDALQAALDNAHDGSTIYLPKGTYRISRPLLLKGPLFGFFLVGDGGDTRLLWSGPEKGRMLEVTGVAYSRFMGFELDGGGRAAVGIYHDSNTRFETQVRHQVLAFKGFTESGLIESPQRARALAETTFENCLFEQCHRGVALLQFNDYDYTFDGCEFQSCDVGVECNHGNFYIRDCHFENSREVDILARSEHGSSIRRCTSRNSAAFVTCVQSVAPMTIQDCRVAGWRNPEGAIRIDGAPTTIFDCVFTNPPDHRPPINLLRSAQRLIQSNNRAVDSGGLLVASNAHVFDVPLGQRSGAVNSPDQHFLPERLATPGRVFDARRDFGALGDGRTDDTLAVQQTIDAARTFGHNAIAYLPSGSYLVSATLIVRGHDYSVGGSGALTRLLWRGPDDGTMMVVQAPRHVTLESLEVGSHDGGPMTNAIDILQRGSAQGSSMTYDGVFVFGQYDKQAFRKGLRFEGLGPRDKVHLVDVTGNLHFTNCAQATVLANCSYDGSLVVESHEAVRNGLLGFETRLTTGCEHPLYLENSSSVVVSDYYVEQADGGFLFEGLPTDPPGRATLQGAKLHMGHDQASWDAAVAIDVRNYRGTVFLGPEQFYTQPDTTRIRQAGAARCQIFLVACSFYSSDLDARVSPSSNVYLIGAERVGGNAPHVEDTLGFVSLGALVPAFDDLRRLGEVDLRFRHGDDW